MPRFNSGFGHNSYGGRRGYWDSGNSSSGGSSGDSGTSSPVHDFVTDVLHAAFEGDEALCSVRTDFRLTAVLLLLLLPRRRRGSKWNAL